MDHPGYFPVGIERDAQNAVVSLEMDDTSEVRPGNAAGITDRHPVLHKGYSLAWLKKRVGLLISEKTRLQLDVGAVVIRERLSPVEPIRVNAPRPDFFRWNLEVFGKMRGACIGVGIPDAHKVFPASMDK